MLITSLLLVVLLLFFIRSGECLSSGEGVLVTLLSPSGLAMPPAALIDANRRGRPP